MTKSAMASRLLMLGMALTAAGCSEVQPTAVVEEATRPSAAAAANYTTVAGNDWQAYNSSADLRAAQNFVWWDSRDVYNYVNVVPDATFGKVVRITFPQNSGSPGSSPQMHQSLSQPLAKMWYRWRMRYEPGWTTVGPDPAGHANSYKVAFWLWQNYEARGGVVFTNSTQYLIEFGVRQPGGSYLQYNERPIPGSALNFGNVSTEWTDNQWYEFVAYYDKTGPTTAQQHYWRRRLTTNGQVAPGPWIYMGLDLSGQPTPLVRGIQLGINKNKNNTHDMYIYWGPWEVVDGSAYPNPWGMPNVTGTTPPPTLQSLAMTPDSASVPVGGTVQFSTQGLMSNGTSASVAVTYSASGGTVSANGLYTAPATAGVYNVVASAQGLADTSRVRVVAPPSGPTLMAVSLTPASATTNTGGTVQFQSAGHYSDGSTGAVAVTYSATGGTVSPTGLYTAGGTAGTYAVIARAANGLADTAAVTINQNVVLQQVNLTPAVVSLATGGTQQFQASGQYSNGTTSAVLVNYSATGGSISATGLYTAGSTAGTYRVIAVAQGSTLADTSVITITPPAPTLQGLTITPTSATLLTGGTQQFNAHAQMSDGSTPTVTATYTASGGSVSAAGLYTAPATAGSYTVTASYSGRTATANVTVTAPPTLPPPTSGYSAEVGDDWRSYTSVAQLQTRNLFSWGHSQSVYTAVSLVSDPLFGQVVRLTQPAGTTATPTLGKTLPSSLAKAWLRYRVRFSPGWRIDGANTGAATYGLADMRWAGNAGMSAMSLLGSSYAINFNVRSSAGTYVRYTETQLGAADLGGVTTEWSAGEWWEYAMYYEQTSATTARMHYWRRKLTSSGQPGSNWVYAGLSISGASTPLVRAINIALTKSKVTPATQYVDLGPWEVVDGSKYPNPWGLTF